MKNTVLVTAIATACSALAFAASPEKSTGSASQGYLKNIARQHYTTTLSLFDPAAQRYVSTEAAAAWLDDDVATGWPALAGKQHYLLQFAEPQLITNFELSTKTPSGTVTLYTGDHDAAPGDKSWTLVAKDVPVESINNQKLHQRINKYAKYLLIETDIADPSPIYSLNVFSERSAASTAIVARPQPIDVKPLLGDFVNNQTAFNMAGIYAKGAVTYANSGGSENSWQRAIDDDPETLLNVKPSTAESGLVVRFDSAYPFTRLSLLTNPNARGKVDIFLLSEAPQASTPVSIEGIAPSVTLTFDGTSQRGSADFAETKAAALAIRWTPESGEAPLALRELNIFADLALSDHEVTGAPTALAQGPTEKSVGDGKSLSDGKAPIAMGPSGKDFKGTSLPPVLAGPGGYDPGQLGFPPILGIPRTGRRPTPTPVPPTSP
ncbi:MAG: hypothetical protein ABI318_01775 [Chthoniobacteraceae bacterium]